MSEEAQLPVRTIRKLLVANRSEIAIRVFRTAHELGIRTVAIYTHEDRFALHRFKADEAYRIGKPGEPIRSYLDIAGIVALAREQDVDAIHPGYGFLSRKPRPSPVPAVRRASSSSARARRSCSSWATRLSLATSPSKPACRCYPGSSKPVAGKEEAHALAEQLGYPVIVKAAMGGGGRGMRVAHTADQLDEALEQARREAGTAFGIPDVFLEKLHRPRPPHRGAAPRRPARQPGPSLRARLLAAAPAPEDRRDRSGSRPRPGPAPALLDAALAIGRAVRLDNAGTVEFLVDLPTPATFYFIEVNPAHPGRAHGHGGSDRL